MACINLYFRKPPGRDRWLFGDRYLMAILRNLLRRKKVSGVEKVFLNLCKGFDELEIDYKINRPFKQIKPGEPVITLGIGRYALEGYKQPNPIIAGIGLMTHPADWPSLCNEYPVVKYLQHSQWTRDIYVPYYGDKVCALWPAGIDTETWSPADTVKKYDFLVYDKIMWDRQNTETGLKSPILHKLDELGLMYTQLRYGQYDEKRYHELLIQSKAMIFLCEHESQGFACCEALSMDVPVFAWDQGLWLDHERFKWNDPIVPATSVPFFNDDCGMKFAGYPDFEDNISLFWDRVQRAGSSPGNMCWTILP